ncbi:hypothetical protein JCM13591A_06340 [Microbacterium xylanilyticum]
MPNSIAPSATSSRRSDCLALPRCVAEPMPEASIRTGERLLPGDEFVTGQNPGSAKETAKKVAAQL